MKCQAKHIGFTPTPEGNSRVVIEVKGEEQINVIVCKDCYMKIKSILVRNLGIEGIELTETITNA